MSPVGEVKIGVLVHKKGSGEKTTAATACSGKFIDTKAHEAFVQNIFVTSPYRNSKSKDK